MLLSRQIAIEVLGSDRIQWAAKSIKGGVRSPQTQAADRATGNLFRKLVRCSSMHQDRADRERVHLRDAR